MISVSDDNLGIISTKMCSHNTIVIWFTPYARHNIKTAKGVKNWFKSIDDTTDLSDVIDTNKDSEVEE